MSKPKLHHWLPQFLMRPWCGEDGLVNRFHRPHKDVVYGRKGLKYLGSENRLYEASWKLIGDPYHYENNIFSKVVDDPSSSLIKKIINFGVGELTPMEKKSFSHFLLLQMIRSSERCIGENQADFISFEEFLLRVRKSESDMKRLDDVSIFNIYVNNIKGSGSHSWIQAMLEFATDPKLVDSILKLEWMLIGCLDTGLDYVLGDKPVLAQIANGKVMEIAIPLSPNILFHASSPDRHSFDPIFSENSREIFIVLNVIEQMKRAKDFVISKNLGRNGGYLKMAEEYMKHPVPS
ncbi:hypothetical protein J2847_005098 [Azospirillum agricola]|uniref:DUF4238 domain-containing protein n=1 Tax=Azospirillum agricola TaxID=1720247 RepID=UPI001AE86A87|nr:DUF4238 domain-containing protein [Azospirillum agricola]MBP2231779.1 hypothetical protein [Azospirillum agricola]